jgi:flagellar basal-body rod protein FlgF
MLRGIYTGASGMVAQQARLDTVANNLANVDKVAYKKDQTIFKSFPDMLIRRINDNGLGITPAGSYDSMPIVGKLGTGVEVNEVFTQFTQGSLQRTENNFDMALKGKGFFAVQTEKGERYTRDGSFTINQDGILMTHNGDPVVGENGIITVQDNNFIVNKRGEIIVNNAISRDPNDVVGENNQWQNPLVIDRIKIVDFENIREIKKVGNSMYKETEFSGPPLPPIENFEVIQGFLEKSNVNVVTEMVTMIEVQRSYEANQKSILTHDQMLSKLINDVGR